jgi:hypothetical protein
MKLDKFKASVGLALALGILGLSACGGGGDGSYTVASGGDGGISGTGIMRMSITDAPACGYDKVNITIEKVRVNKASDAADNDAGWSDIVLNPAKQVDLLTLTNGVMEALGQTSLPAGKYTQMRLVLASNTGANPYANSIVLTGGGGAKTALTTPSGQQSGIKLKVDLDVASGQLADFAIDFDACKSIVKRGNSGQYNLKPVISVIPMLSDAGLRVVGYVAPAIANSSTSISLQQGGVPIKATVPNASGTFILYPVPAGSYNLVVSAAGRVTAVMTGVPVVATSYTTLNSTSTAILPPVATTTTVTGTATPATATVRALQTLTGASTPTIEVAWGAVDEGTGVFSIVLPNEAPVTAVYAANSITPTFAMDAGAKGLYKIEAASGSATKSQGINTAGTVPPIVFSIP